MTAITMGQASIHHKKTRKEIGFKIRANKRRERTMGIVSRLEAEENKESLNVHNGANALLSRCKGRGTYYQSSVPMEVRLTGERRHRNASYGLSEWSWFPERDKTGTGTGGRTPPRRELQRRGRGHVMLWSSPPQATTAVGSPRRPARRLHRLLRPRWRCMCFPPSPMSRHHLTMCPDPPFLLLPLLGQCSFVFLPH